MVVWVDGGTRLVLAHSTATLFGDQNQTLETWRSSVPAATRGVSGINRSRDILPEPYAAGRRSSAGSRTQATLRTVTASHLVAEERAPRNKVRRNLAFACRAKNKAGNPSPRVSTLRSRSPREGNGTGPDRSNRVLALH
jgi:hypothetical protein